MRMRKRAAVHVVFVLFFCLMLSWSSFGQAKPLASGEVRTLELIAAKLRKTRWDFNELDPCSWIGKAEDQYNTTITCDCNSTTCHVTGIWLKGHNISGELPEEFADLTYLAVLDLTRNYFSGSIPTKWASLPLTSLSLLGNKISGKIPNELGDISSLQELILANNLMQGSIPESLGKLTSLRRLLLSANNLTGVLPESLGELKNLTDFRIDGNPISGKIPNFIGNWTKLTRLDMQGTLIEGPFPITFSELTSITDLRVTDWMRGDGQFPALGKMTKMKELVLRNLSISGEIPKFIGNMAYLKNLDLSFNNLTGNIPNNIGGLSHLDYVYLTNNKLTGTIMDWIQSKGSWDFSYNSFSGSAPSRCDSGTMNVVSSYSTTNDNSIPSCLRKNLPCAGKAENYELYINCGGRNLVFEGKTYQDDTNRLGPSVYKESSDQTWACSNTGDFISDERALYIATNKTALDSSVPELYTTARISPLCLRYYGFCLQRGNYTVKLHFAEIMFTNDQTYASVGRRIFDVWIQGEKVLQDFDIASENGTGRVVIKEFTTLVNDTLEIHFQWTGKGTNSIPVGGVYGPLVSAISVTPNFKPKIGGSKLSAGAIIGIVLSTGAMVVFSAILIWLRFLKKGSENDELRGLSSQTGYFTLKQIKAATKNFDTSNKIGEGGFGPVYKGVLLDGTEIAVKQLSSKSKQGNREFINEIGMISALQHPNLVKLYGCCIEGNQLLLVYEYMENNSLARALFGPEKYRLKLDWQTRLKICLGVARGLAYLHEESRLKIVHRDIKATNILLDSELNAKISDFGLAKLDEEENTHISTRVAGTIGYMAPEYAMRGYLTDKADVYSFGVVTLEIVSGISNTNFKPKEQFVYLLDWAYVLQEEGNMLELVDKNLGSDYSKEEALQMLNLALACTNPSPTLRPTMSTVVSMLEGKIPVKVMPVSRTKSKTQEARFRAFERLTHDSHRDSGFMEEQWTDSAVTGPSSSIFGSNSPSTNRLLSDHSE